MTIINNVFLLRYCFTVPVPFPISNTLSLFWKLSCYDISQHSSSKSYCSPINSTLITSYCLQHYHYTRVWSQISLPSHYFCSLFTSSHHVSSQPRNKASQQSQYLLCVFFTTRIMKEVQLYIGHKIRDATLKELNSRIANTRVAFD